MSGMGSGNVTENQLLLFPLFLRGNHSREKIGLFLEVEEKRGRGKFHIHLAKSRFLIFRNTISIYGKKPKENYNFREKDSFERRDVA